MHSLLKTLIAIVISHMFAGCISLHAGVKPRVVTETIDDEKQVSFSPNLCFGFGGEIFAPFPIGLRLMGDQESYRGKSRSGSYSIKSDPLFMEGFVGLAWNKPQDSMALSLQYFYMSLGLSEDNAAPSNTRRRDESEEGFIVARKNSAGTHNETPYIVREYRRIAIGHSWSVGAYTRRGFFGPAGGLARISLEFAVGTMNLYAFDDVGLEHPLRRNYVEIGIIGTAGGGLGLFSR